MQSLYDVYCAIQADEADHVSAMEACLDPNVALVSPSIEKRVLTAAALITALGLAVSGGGGLDFGMDGTSLESAASDGSLETTAASLGALASQLMGGSLLDNFGANDGAVEGSEFLAESLTVEKALSSVLGGLAAVLGLSNISQRRKEEIRDEDNSVDKDDDLS